MIGWAIEAFIEELTTRAYQISEANGDAKITPSHIKEVIVSGAGGGGAKMSTDVKGSYGFLKAGLAGIPDLARKELPNKNENEKSWEESISDSPAANKKIGGVRRK